MPIIATTPIATQETTVSSPNLATDGGQLFSRFPIIASADLDEVRSQVAKVFCDHKLQVIGKSQRLDTRMYFRQGRHTGFGRMSYGATVDINPGSLDDFFLLQFPLFGEETIFSEGQSVASTANLATIVSPTADFHMRHDKSAEKLFVRIDRCALERECVQFAGAPLKGPLKFAPGIPLETAAGQALRRYISWLMQEASDGVLLDYPIIAAQFEDALITALLGTLSHNQRNTALRTPLAITPHFVRRAEEYMEQHAHEPITASDIACHSGISTRSLFAGFRKYRDTTPMARLRALRLAKAHASLSSPESDQDSVTQIALRWGFSHLGQFSASYRRSYGEVPSLTLRRAIGNARTRKDT
jgi:AraC-like DNA-binding protein